MQFEFPELALLVFPLWLAFRRWGRARGVTGWLRLALVAVLLFALTGPRLDVGGHGVDVIVVAEGDRLDRVGPDDGVFGELMAGGTVLVNTKGHVAIMAATAVLAVIECLHGVVAGG